MVEQFHEQMRRLDAPIWFPDKPLIADEQSGLLVPAAEVLARVRNDLIRTLVDFPGLDRDEIAAGLETLSGG